MSDDITPRQIVRYLAEGDHWDEDGCCAVCGGEVDLVDHDDGVQRYQYGKARPGTHTALCPWMRAQRWVEARYGSAE